MPESSVPINKPDRFLDIIGEVCPSCSLELMMELGEMDSGEILSIVTSDSSTLRDFPTVCKMKGHEVLASTTNQAGNYEFTIQRA